MINYKLNTECYTVVYIFSILWPTKFTNLLKLEAKIQILNTFLYTSELYGLILQQQVHTVFNLNVSNQFLGSSLDLQFIISMASIKSILGCCL